MDPNQTRRFANFSFVILAVYAPIETWASFPELLSPYYLVDVVGMLLLALGIFYSRRDRPLLSLISIAAGWAWLGANGWRATADRFEHLAQGGQLEFGAAELCFVVCSTILSIGGLAWSLILGSRASREGNALPRI